MRERQQEGMQMLQEFEDPEPEIWQRGDPKGQNPSSQSLSRRHQWTSCSLWPRVWKRLELGLLCC